MKETWEIFNSFLVKTKGRNSYYLTQDTDL